MAAQAQLALGRSDAVTGDQARAVFGQVMGIVALTLGCTTLGAFIGRDLNGGIAIAFFVAGIACIVGLNIASRRGHERLSTTFLFGLGLLIGLALGPALNAYAHTDPSALWQAAGATGAFVAALGAVGYATRRDLSSWTRTLLWALLSLIVFGIVALFVAIPNAHVIWAVAGLGIFGAFTIFDFNRLRRSGIQSAAGQCDKPEPGRIAAGRAPAGIRPRLC
jgi:FtsH-binding integral membrane protein